MPSFELSKLQAVTGPRALSSTDRTATKPTSETSVTQSGSAPASAAGVSLEVSTKIDTSAPPIDNERVQEIKTALRDGNYPLVPAEIADAIIAAQVSFGMPQ